MRSIRDVNCAVVGGAGFLGSQLTDVLIEERKCKVLVIDNLVSGRREFVHKEAVFEHADIVVSEARLKTLFEQYKIEYVFNYTACPFVPLSAARPLYVFSINATGALHVLNSAQEAGVKAILQVSSAEIYSGLQGKIKEDAQVFPHSSYGVSKAAIDSLVQVRWRESQTPCISLRQFNCYGKRPTWEYVIPTIIDQLSRSNVVKLGNNSRRDFQFSLDAVRMAVELLEKGQFGEVVNMGSEQSIQIYDLAHLIGKLMGHEKIEIQVDPSRFRKWELWSLESCNDKLYSIIDYRPETTFEQGLKETIAYYYEKGGWGW